MHVPDGFMSPQVNMAAFAVSLAACGVAFRKTDQTDERLAPLMGVTSAFIFASQMINFPVAPGASGHFLGAAFATIIIGPWRALVAMTVTVILQALLFADGGLTAIGTNVFNMGVLACGVAWLTHTVLMKILPATPRSLFIAAAASAWVSVVASSSALVFELAISGTSPFNVAFPAIAGIHSLIGIGEALITASALSVIFAARPEMAGWKPSAGSSALEA